VGDGRQEAVQLAVDLDRLRDLAAVELEAAIEVVELDPATRLVTALNSRDGTVLLSGSWRSCFQPETRSSPPSIAARRAGSSAGSSCRSASSVATSSPRACGTRPPAPPTCRSCAGTTARAPAGRPPPARRSPRPSRRGSRRRDRGSPSSGPWRRARASARRAARAGSRPRCRAAPARERGTVAHRGGSNRARGPRRPLRPARARWRRAARSRDRRRAAWRRPGCAADRPAGALEAQLGAHAQRALEQADGLEHFDLRAAADVVHACGAARRQARRLASMASST